MLRAKQSWITQNKFQSQTEASIGLFFKINPKFTLRYVLKQKIEEICIWINLDDEDTKVITKETTSNHTIIQELVIHSFDIYNKVFGYGLGTDHVTTTVYGICISLEHAAILKSILCKASEPDNHPTLQFIPNGIKGITHKVIYKTRIQKQNAFIQ